MLFLPAALMTVAAPQEPLTLEEPIALSRYVTVTAEVTKGPIPAPAQDGLFPLPSEDLILPAGGESTWTMLDLVDAYATSTKQQVHLSDDTKTYLQSVSTGLRKSAVIPKARVQSFFEGLLVEKDFVLSIVQEEEPRLLSIYSLNSGHRHQVRSRAHYVTADNLPKWQDHPAILVTTTVNLPNTDVRQLSNSMRTMITDANTQQMLPAGSTNSMVITGRAANVVPLVAMLKQVDASAAFDSVAQTFHRFPLQHADSQVVAPLIEDLLGAVFMTVTGHPQNAHMGRTRARVVPDARTNALVILCAPADLERVKSLVSLFDAPGEK